MISRVAEHCFWMSRYLERAENAARLLEVNQTLLLDFAVPVEQQWRPVLIISGIHDRPEDMDGEAVQNFMTWEVDDNPSSIASSIAAARENARNIREVISAESWERMNFYYLWMESPGARALYHTDRTGFYNRIRRINQLIAGINEGTMSHGEAWDFYRLGHYLERASQIARILDVKYHILLPTLEHVGTPVDNAHWVAILTSCSGYEPYTKERFDSDPGVAVPDFLIFDSLFPRSVRFCLNRCRAAAYAISGRQPGRPGNAVEHALEDLSSWLNLTKIDDFIQAGLHEALTSIIDRIHGIGDAIHRTYFDQRSNMIPEEWAAAGAAADPGAVPQSTA
ncbi:alpha-E domain-containing protein [Aquisphaera insulae]|uniref:alpha-E domain-containing protein n=1 Tax=Aquisphaera insulae TaxID=2712864 RepID=UPI0013EE2465|nr:alpha-E domain-containing protein [Aquisphaera insulae]